MKTPLARRWPRWFALAVALFVVLRTTAALAAGPGGRLAVWLPDGSRPPLVLHASQGGWIGELTIGNTGNEPLSITRLSLLGGEEDVRSPARLSVRFAEGPSTTASLAPGESKDVIVTWTPDKDSRVRQAFGEVVVTSSDEAAGEVAMGVRAQLPTGLGWIGAHALSLLVLGPLLVVIAALVTYGRPWGPMLAARLSVCVAGGELLLAAWAFHHFVPGVGRAEGNEGFQLVERAVWVRSTGIEWYLGVDGSSVGLVLLVAAVSFVAALVASLERRPPGYYAALALLASGVMGAVVAVDLAALFFAWEIVWLALVLIVGAWGGPRGASAAVKVAVAGAVALGALTLSFAALWRASGPAYLVDGTLVRHSLAIPELGRTAFGALRPLAGLPYAAVTWWLLFVPAAIVCAVVPFHRWLPDALQQAPGGGGIVLGSAVAALGPYLLVRVGIGAMPDAARWASASTATLGALGAVWGALCATAQNDLRRFVAYATTASSGIALYGIGALTPQGIAGATVGLFAHGLGAVLVLGVATALVERVSTCDAQRARALVAHAPVLRVALACGLAVSLGVPGFAGAWSGMLVLLGGFPRYPLLAFVVAGSLVASAAAHVRIGRLLLTGSPDPRWRDDTQLAPYEGRLPDATTREIAAFVPAAVLAFVVGLWPTPVLDAASVSAHDLSAAADPDGPDARLERGN